MTMTLTWESDQNLTCDAFLGGQLSVWQPRVGYRAGVDPVLLAAAVTATPGQAVLELGCGVGVAGLCLQKRVGALALTGLELQAEYAGLAQRNAAANELTFEIVSGDLANMPLKLREQSFDHVIANPPYYDRSSGTASENTGRETSLGEVLPLVTWIDAATRRLSPKGFLTIIQKADRLPDLLAASDDRLGDMRLLPLVPRLGKAAELIIFRARKGAKGGFRLLSPVVLHDGGEHREDGDDYSNEARAILRDGKQLEVDWR